MRSIDVADRVHYRRLNTAELRSHFLMENLFQPGRAELVYTDVDRAIVGGIMPAGAPLGLEAGAQTASAYFCERREAGVINLGGPGHITVDGRSVRLAPRECLYIGRGSREVLFSSDDPKVPAQFYLLSYPAHAAFPTAHATLAEANAIHIGTEKEANCRTIYQYIHPHGIRSCQLVMGFTEMRAGGVWNTFPPHTHARRTEVYCYFDIPAPGVIFHFLGEPEETRHLVVREKQAVLSPPWSIHSGVGAGSYRFVWGMGGENQVFDDMDKVDMSRFN